ncbi:glycerate kinase [Virgibacillus halophilus]|uniref:Glycerate kinase n=1 Tax=Tigheibacillus halophilus TaxID=361280 RepID=A0ABU5C4F0_9BACI|nr:glycerate kinase [Virgibacillus halophilus]
MKIIIAPDSFKGSLNAKEVAEAVDRGIKNAFPKADTVQLPMADGGEGTMDILVSTTNGRKRDVSVTGPLGEQVSAAYGVLGDGKTCVIEVASASGLDHVAKDRLAPLEATTYGTGELIKLALDEGFTTFIIGLGGSATNDGGAGMLQALGAKLLDADGKEIGFGGGELKRVHAIDLSEFDARIPTCDFLIASDVKNPLVGPNGASHVFGPQKRSHCCACKSVGPGAYALGRHGGRHDWFLFA